MNFRGILTILAAGLALGLLPSALAGDRIQLVNPTNSAKTRTSAIEVSTNGQIVTANSVASAAVEGANSGPGAAGQVVKLGGDGLVAPSMLPAAPAAMPVGAIIAFGATNAPSGWLLCDGSAVSRSTYSNLFAVVGTIHGLGDGTNTFNLPNLQGRFPMGASAGYLIGTSGGSNTVTLTADQLPTHSHTLLSDAGVPLRWAGAGGVTAGYSVNSSGGNLNADPQATSTSGTGGGGAFTNLPPYQVLNYIIKD